MFICIINLFHLIKVVCIFLSFLSIPFDSVFQMVIEKFSNHRRGNEDTVVSGRPLGRLPLTLIALN